MGRIRVDRRLGGSDCLVGVRGPGGRRDSASTPTCCRLPIRYEERGEKMVYMAKASFRSIAKQAWQGTRGSRYESSDLCTSLSTRGCRDCAPRRALNMLVAQTRKLVSCGVRFMKASLTTRRGQRVPDLSTCLVLSVRSYGDEAVVRVSRSRCLSMDIEIKQD